ncbi:MAG: type III pantothenate kinase [Candidatus Omnitrophota bacterium]
MTCAIDIGNSTIGFAFFNKDKPQRVYSIENEPQSELVRVKLANFLESVASKHPVKTVVICSVVPDVLKSLSARIRKAWGINPLVIGRHLKIPIKNRYKSPRQVGKDRLLCAYAARELYGAPAVVIDLGTAITFDGISPKGDYLGGAIIPGLRLSAEALFEKTALLPRVNITEPKKVIGATTEESIQSGLFHGYGALCDGMVLRLGEEMKCHPKVVMTGGHAPVMRRFMKHPVEAVDDHLIFKGMAMLAGQ